MTRDERVAELYRRHGPAIYARCRRLLGNAAAAEDAAQETFVRAYRSLDRAPDDASAKLWIYRIATNHCLDLLRSRARGAPAPDAPVPADGRSAEEILADRDLARRVIEEAPSRVRSAAFLHYLDGLDQGQVASVLGVSRRTVGNWIAEFLRHARELVSREPT
jgi:RNA polymerase sigma-70 factor, ECF subfamily